jgi:hypothetical protein
VAAPPPLSPLPPPHTPPMLNNRMPSVIELENNAELDFRKVYNEVFQDENLFDDPYANVTLDSKFYNLDTIESIRNSGNALYLSLNIQSLNSKFDELKVFILELHQKGLNIEVIALQETWEIQYPEYLIIPGYQQIAFKNRLGMRGGGVGFM